jgi:hypothetical protein
MVVTDWDYPRTAEKAFDYFDHQEGTCEKWIDGLRAAECWLASLTEGRRFRDCQSVMA